MKASTWPGAVSAALPTGAAAEDNGYFRSFGNYGWMEMLAFNEERGPAHRLVRGRNAR